MKMCTILGKTMKKKIDHGGLNEVSQSSQQLDTDQEFYFSH